MERSYYKDYFVLEREHWFFRVREKILLYFIKKHAKPGSGVFDFGCGSGYLVGELQKMGYNAYGIDFEKEAIDYGINSGIKNLTLGSGNKSEYPDESFDLIMALDALEHIENEKPVITELSRVLKPGGHILITVPAYMWLWGVQDEISHHFRRYTMNSLISVLGEFPEFKIVRKTYFNSLLFPAIAFVRLLSRWLGVKNRSSDFEIGNRVMGALFYFIFNLETYLLKFINFPFGVSILVVLEKSKLSHEQKI